MASKAVVKSFHLILILTAALTLTGCDKLLDIVRKDRFLNFLMDKFGSEPEAVLAPEPDAENPCLKPWVIQGIKNNIIEQAQDKTVTAFGADSINEELLSRVEISIDNITPAAARDDNRAGCKAQVTINYLGNEQTDPDLTTQLVQLLNSEYFSELFESFGIDSALIANLSNLRGNSFSALIDYDVGKAYNEAGEEEENYFVYRIAAPAAMLAAMAEFDKQTQSENETLGYHEDIGSAEAAAQAMAEAELAHSDEEWGQEDQQFVQQAPSPEARAPKGSRGLGSVRVRDYVETDSVVVEATATEDSYDYETAEIYEEDVD